MPAQHSSTSRSPQRLFDQALSHFQSQSTASTLLIASTATLALFAALLVSDYHAWRACGTGGTPPTPAGYWRMTKIRIAALLAPKSMLDISKLSTEGPTYLTTPLPDRTKQRPRMQSSTMPQRQHPVELGCAAKERLHALPKKYCDAYPSLLRLDLSDTEGRSTLAIYALDDLPNRPASASSRVLKNEIAHVHHAENSLHVWLSQPDARKVLEAGWGERFPLTPEGVTPEGLTFVYAPRSMEDVDVIEEIVKAGIAYVIGEIV